MRFSFLKLSIIASSCYANDVLIHIHPQKIDEHIVTESEVVHRQLPFDTDIIVPSTMTPNTMLAFKRVNDIGYRITRYDLPGLHYWPTKDISIIGDIEKIVPCHNSVFFTTSLGHMYEYDEETSHLVSYSGNCLPTFLKESNRGVYIIEPSDQSKKGFTKFRVIEINKNDISDHSQEFEVPATKPYDLMAKRMGNGFILTARKWSNILKFEAGLGVTTIPIEFFTPSGALVMIRNITTDYLHKIYVHLVSDERSPVGYFLTIANGKTTQQLASHNILSMRKNADNEIIILAAETPWHLKGYYRFFMDIVRNSEQVRVLDEHGVTKSEFRLQTETFRGIPGLLKNGLIASTHKTSLGLELVLHNASGEQLLSPCLMLSDIRVFSDGSCVILGKNNKKKLDWTFYNSVYFLKTGDSDLVHIADSPTAISLRNWQKL